METPLSLISSYSKFMYPIRNNKDSVILKDIYYTIVLSSKSWQLVGRPRKKRIRLCGKIKHIRCCGRYGDYKHNRKMCEWPSHYILKMNIVVSILLRAISTSKNSPYNQFITHFNSVTIEFHFWGWFSYVSTFLFLFCIRT